MHSLITHSSIGCFCLFIWSLFCLFISFHLSSLSLLLMNICESAVYDSYTVWYIHQTLPSIFLPGSFLTEILSLDHPSAFLDRRRYYETYVRYVVLFVCLFLIPSPKLGSSKNVSSGKGGLFFNFHFDSALDLWMLTLVLYFYWDEER